MNYKFIDENGKHLHTLDDKSLTGTTSIIDVLAKPLTWWASGMAVGKLGWVTEKKRINGKYVVVNTLEQRLESATKHLEIVKTLTPEAYLNLLDEAYKAHKTSLDKSARTGTNLHAELEKFVKAEMGIWNYEDEDLDPKIKPFIEWSKKNVEEYLWSEAHCFDEELWIGGVSDAGAKLKDGKLAIFDFKSSKEAFANQFIQVAGYAIQIEKNGLWDKNGEKNKKLEGKIDTLFIVPFGAEIIEPVARYDVDAYKEGFRWAVGLYRLLGLTDEN